MERHPLDMRLDVGGGGDRGTGRRLIPGRGTREDREHVPVRPDTQEDQVQHRGARGVGGDGGREVRRVVGRRPGRAFAQRERLGDRPSVELLHGDLDPRVAQQRQEDLLERQDVGQRMVPGHEPVVAPPGVDAGPVHPLAERRRPQGPVDARRGGPAGRGPVGDPARGDGIRECLRDGLRRGRGDGLGVDDEQAGQGRGGGWIAHGTTSLRRSGLPPCGWSPRQRDRARPPRGPHPGGPRRCGAAP